MDDIASSGHGPFPKGDPAGTKIGRFCRGPVLRFDWPKPQDLKPLVLASLAGASCNLLESLEGSRTQPFDFIHSHVRRFK